MIKKKEKTYTTDEFKEEVKRLSEKRSKNKKLFAEKVEADNDKIWLTNDEGNVFNGEVLLDFIKEVRRRYGEGVVRSILKDIKSRRKSQLLKT